MKKLLSLIILLSAGTAYSAETSKEDASDKVALTTEQSDDAETVENEQPSFLVRHADLIENASHGIDAVALGVTILHKIVFKDKHEDTKDRILCNIYFYSFIIKCLLDPLTKYSMDKKHTLKLKALQKKLDSNAKEKILTKEQSFFIRNTDTFKKISYAADFLSIPLLILLVTLQEKNKKPAQQSNLVKTINLALALTYIEKIFLHPTIKYLMNKKHTFELEALQAKLDAAQQEATQAA